MTINGYHLDNRIYDIGNSGTAFTADWSLASIQKVTINNNVTGITFLNGISGAAYLMEVAIGVSSLNTVTGWPTAVKWPGSTAPVITTTTNTAKTDLINFYYNGANWLGSFTQNY
jgi:hypothetical protein